jgi:basic amino acid/polyamine antiporter, APA family
MVNSGELRREVGLVGAVAMGLGSILGTGVFVSIAIAAGVAGSAILLAVPLAALVAVANGLSSAQLAAAHPVSGGTYEYGYRYLSPSAGFAAGWLFLLAKTASAATAALGLAGYVLVAFGWHPELAVPLAVAAVAVLTVIVASGVRRSSTANLVIVTLTVAALGTFVLTGLAGGDNPILIGDGDLRLPSLLEATALMFVAYTGYGRIATMGEEVRDPARIIPVAVVVALAVTALLYLGVAAAGLRLGGADGFAATLAADGAPLAALTEGGVARLVEVGAVTAMLGVLLNLILGLSRVWLAMGRRRDMPAALSEVAPSGSPVTAVVWTGAVIGGTALIGDVRVTWAFSAFTVLLYYAITNLAALRLPADDRRFPRWVAWAGLAACAFLAWWVDPLTWLAGFGLLAAGFGARAILRRRSP